MHQDKIEVNGRDAHPLYKFLKEQTKSGDLEVGCGCWVASQP